MDQPNKPFNPEHTKYVSSIIFDILVTIVTCGIYYFFIQHRQIQALNHMLGRPKYSFIKWLLFTIITCGIYHLYHEYIMAGDIAQVIGEKSSNFQLLMLALAIVGLPMIADAIMQDKLNKHFGFDQL